MQKYFFQFLLLLQLIFFGGTKVLAQNDLPVPSPFMVTFPSGSLVVGMDNSTQAVGVAFNLKAYGLLNLLLQHEIKLHWIINSNKGWNGIDFTATAVRETPTVLANFTYSFRSGPFIIDSIFADTARSIINSYGRNVATYRLTQSVTVDRRYQLTFKPNIAVLSNGNNQNIHLNYLEEAGFLVDTTVNMNITPADTQMNVTPADTQMTITPADTQFVITPADTQVVITPADTQIVITPADTQIVISGTDTTYIITPADTTYNITPADTTYNITPADTTYNITPADTTYIYIPADTTYIYTPADTTYYNSYSAPWVTVIPASDVLDWGGCYTFASEPHWDTYYDTTHTYPVKRFMLNGSNFLAQCEGVETYEDDDTIMSYGGIDVANANFTYNYFNAPMPYAQINGALGIIGGSLRNWSLTSGSTYRSTYYRVVGSANGFYNVAAASKILPNNYVGGNAFYLGGHDYGGGPQIDKINGRRMYLNCIFVPANPLGTCSQLFALPIELLSFDAHYNGEDVELYWTTATEINNQYFTIEKTTDGENFSFVAKIEGAGNSNSSINYKTIDEDPWPGVSYYRLSQTDFDGTTWYSDLVPVRIKSKEDIFYVSPNPTTYNNLTVNFNSWENGEVQLVVENIMGQIIHSEKISTQAGDFIRKKLNFGKELSNGIYLITVKSENRSQNQKVIVH